MRVFTCDNCGQVVFFDNDLCLRCSSPLGYLHDTGSMVSLTQIEGGALVDTTGSVKAWERCGTRALTGCNWLVPAGSGQLCPSCVLTRTRPADDDTTGVSEWVKAEAAKRRLIYQLGRLGLPVPPRDETRETGLAFDLLSSAEQKVVTGHDNGIITLDLAEADSEHREQLRRQLGEPYRTLLGHFRHEIGHYFWPVLVTDDTVLAACRALFGDDSEDYGEAVSRHYAKGDEGPEVWRHKHISQYATMHPYEDWAETFAHYLHIHDTLQTAESFGLGAGLPFEDGFGGMIDRWLMLARGLNEVNRSMGHRDLYPFVLAPTVVRKLSFVDQVIQQARRRAA